MVPDACVQGGQGCVVQRQAVEGSGEWGWDAGVVAWLVHWSHLCCIISGCPSTMAMGVLDLADGPAVHCLGHVQEAVGPLWRSGHLALLPICPVPIW